MDIDHEVTPTSIVQPGANRLDIPHQDSDRVSDDSGDGDDDVEIFAADFSEAEDGFQPDVHVIYPRQSYVGACNVKTIKDG